MDKAAMNFINYIAIIKSRKFIIWYYLYWDVEH